MVFALALVLSLVLAAALASMVTAPLRRMANATRMMARGDLSVRVPGSKLEELGALAESFNDMAAKLKKSFDDLVGEVETRKGRERELKESEARCARAKSAGSSVFETSTLGIMTDIDHDQLVWDHRVPALRPRKDEYTRELQKLSRSTSCRGGGARANADRQPSFAASASYEVRLHAAAKGRSPIWVIHVVGADHPRRGRPARSIVCINRHRHDRPTRSTRRATVTSCGGPRPISLKPRS